MAVPSFSQVVGDVREFLGRRRAGFFGLMTGMAMGVAVWFLYRVYLKTSLSEIQTFRVFAGILGLEIALVSFVFLMDKVFPFSVRFQASLVTFFLGIFYSFLSVVFISSASSFAISIYAIEKVFLVVWIGAMYLDASKKGEQD